MGINDITASFYWGETTLISKLGIYDHTSVPAPLGPVLVPIGKTTVAATAGTLFTYVVLGWLLAFPIAQKKKAIIHYD